VLEIDDRRRPTNRDDMWSEWNLGQRQPVGDYVEEEPWCVTEEVLGVIFGFLGDGWLLNFLGLADFPGW